MGVRPHQLPPALRQELKSHPWPGNVRQLQHALTLAAALADPGAQLRLSDFNLHAQAPSKQEGAPITEDALDIGKAMRHSIAQAMERTGGNVAAAAVLLGISRATLYRKLRRM